MKRKINTNHALIVLLSLLFLGAAYSSDAMFYVPAVDSTDNVTITDVIGNKDDTANDNGGGGNSLMSMTKGINNTIGATADHHEHVWPRTNGQGVVAPPFEITTDSQDEDTGAQSNQNYWGEPITFDPGNTAVWKFTGMYIEADTASKTFQYHILTCNPSESSDKNGGVAWDKTGTVLTVDDGSVFATSDFVAIVSDYKSEIAIVQGVVGNAVTIAREGHAVGINGLRWNHTTNDPGTEVLYRVGRPSVTANHPMAGLYSAASSKDSTRFNFFGPRAVEANGFILIRLLNQTDGTNGASFHAAIIYED